MKVLNVEFAPRRPVSVWLWGGIALALAAIAALQGWAGWTLHRQAAVQERDAAQLAARLDQAEQARRDAMSRVKPVPAYARDAATVARAASFSYERVLASLESTQVPGVKVTAVEVTAADRSARVELEFADHDALMRYLDDINAGEPKPRWVLLQAQTGTGAPAAALGGGAAANSAAIGAKWNEGGP